MASSLAFKKTNFVKGISKWLLENKYNVGIPAEDMDVRKDLEEDELIGVKLAENIVSIISNGDSPRISGGKIGKEDLTQLLLPFIQLSDVVGYDFVRGSNLFLTIFADSLTPTEVEQRITAFLDSGKPLRKRAGIRIQLRPSDLEIELLLTYFDKNICKRDMATLMPKVSKYDMRTQVRVHTWYANIPDRMVLRGVRKGVFSGNWSPEESQLGSLKGIHEATKKIGGRIRGFYTEHLTDVLRYANL